MGECAGTWRNESDTFVNGRNARLYYLCKRVFVHFMVNRKIECGKSLVMLLLIIYKHKTLEAL